MRTRGTRLVIAAVVVAVAAGVSSRDPLSPRAPTVALGAPTFVDETASAGVEHTYDGGFAYAVGGGVAVFDCDGDGKPDLFLAGGSNPGALYRNVSAIGGALRFTRVGDAATDLTLAPPLRLRRPPRPGWAPGV